MDLNEQLSDKRHIVTLTVDELIQSIISAIHLELSNDPEKQEFEEKEKEDITQILVSRKDLAKMFDVSTVSLDKWKRAGLLPKPIKMAGRVYYLKSEIMEMIEKRKSR